jgi:hypothetical protein
MDWTAFMHKCKKHGMALHCWQLNPATNRRKKLCTRCQWDKNYGLIEPLLYSNYDKHPSVPDSLIRG